MRNIVGALWLVCMAFGLFGCGTKSGEDAVLDSAVSDRVLSLQENNKPFGDSRKLETNADPRSRIGVIGTSDGRVMMGLLEEFGETAKLVDISMRREEIMGLNLLIVPQAGLHFIQSEQAKVLFRQFVENGGVLLVMCQKTGHDYSVLPVEITAYGLQQASSQTTSNVWIEDKFIDHAIFATMSSRVFSLPLDGFFSKYPDDAMVMLRSVTSNNAVLLSVPLGTGRIVLTSAFLTDKRRIMNSQDAKSRHEKGRLSEAEVLQRDLVSWLKKPAKLAVLEPEEKSINLGLNDVWSFSHTTGQARARLSVMNPSRSRTAMEKVVPFGASGTNGREQKIVFRPDWARVRSECGIWHTMVEPIDSDGTIVGRTKENLDGRFIVNCPKLNRTYSPKEVTATVVSNAEQFGQQVPAVFDVIVTNYGEKSRHLRVEWRYHKTWASGIIYDSGAEKISLGPGESYRRRLTLKPPGYRSPSLWCIVYDLENREAIVASSAKKVFYHLYPAEIRVTAVRNASAGDSLVVNGWNLTDEPLYGVLHVSVEGVPEVAKELEIGGHGMATLSLPVQLSAKIPEDDISASARCTYNDYAYPDIVLGDCNSDVRPYDKMKILQFSLQTDRDVYRPGDEIRARLSFFNRCRRNLYINYKTDAGDLGSFEGSTFVASTDVVSVNVLLDVPRNHQPGPIELVTSYWDNTGSRRKHTVKIVVEGSMIDTVSKNLFPVVERFLEAPARVAVAPVLRIDSARTTGEGKKVFKGAAARAEAAGREHVEIDRSTTARPVFNHAICAFGKIELLDNFIVSGFDADTGSAVESGSVAAHGDLFLKNGAQVRGDVVAGGDIHVSRDAIVYHNLYLGGKLDLGRRAVLKGNVHALSMAPMPCECGYDLDGVLGYRRRHNGNDAIDIDGTAMLVEGNDRIELSEGIYFFESMVLRGRAVLSLKPGARVEVYVAGEINMLDESALLNDPSWKSSLLLVAGTDTGKGEHLVIRTSKDLSLFLYAPRADMFYKGRARWLGAMVVHDFRGEGVGGLWIDERLSVSPVVLTCESR